MFFSPSFPASLFASVPQVITVHDLIFDRYPAYMPSRWARPYYRLLMKLSSRKAQTSVVVSRATRDDLVRYYRIPLEKIVVVPEGVDPHFQPVQDEAQLRITRERYSLSEHFILVVGARRPHKNLARLVHAFAELDTAQPYQLVFAGPVDRRFPDEASKAAEQERTEWSDSFSRLGS
jgi:glycosyltransferase involved in cell wall biosynthesis